MKLDMNQFVGDVKYQGKLHEFITHMERAPVSDIGLYHRQKEYDSYKFDFLHKKLDEAGFVNGQPDQNTFEKNPDAHFWFSLYYFSTINFGRHHATTLEQRTALLEKLTELSKTLGAV